MKVPSVETTDRVLPRRSGWSSKTSFVSLIFPVYANGSRGKPTVDISFELVLIKAPLTTKLVCLCNIPTAGVDYMKTI